MDSSRGVKLVAALMEVARFGRLRIAESSDRINSGYDAIHL